MSYTLKPEEVGVFAIGEATPGSRRRAVPDQRGPFRNALQPHHIDAPGFRHLPSRRETHSEEPSGARRHTGCGHHPITVRMVHRRPEIGL